MLVDISRMFTDYDWTNEPYKPGSFGELINGKRGRIFSQICFPGGEAPHPVIVICHGLPGNEKMADFAVIFRHIGFCTITFHYSGSWGSDGVFSIGNCMEDMGTVLEYVLRNEKGLFDLNNIFLIGHSMGGLIGANALAGYPELKAGALIMPADIGGMYLSALKSNEAYDNYRAIFDSFGEWLNGFSWSSFVNEAEASNDRFDLAKYADELAEKPLLAIAGALDDDLPREEHIDLLIAAIKAKDRGKLQEITFPTNHSMSDQRNSIIRAIAEFFSLHMD